MKFKETSDAKKGGLFVGKSHDEGGIPAIVTDTGTPIEVEGGEAIINKEATALHWKELSKINQSAGNGVPIPPPHGVSEKITDKLENGGKLTHKDRKDIYKKWKGLVNMTASELEKYYNSEDGKTSGLTESEAQKQGIDSGRESARWIIKMKRTKLAEWTPEMWRWANKQISFISRMKGVKGELFDNKGRRTRKHKALLIWGHNPKKYKGSGIFDGGGMTDKEFFETEKKSWQQEKDDFKEGGKTIAQTPAPQKDRIYGSEKNKPESSSSVKSASKIEFDDKTLAIIENKVEEHNEEHPDKKITLSSAKAVVRRGMGAYSSSHRPTISGGKPNSRTAWGIARLNAFIYKIVHGKSKSGKYSQDDDLINDLGYSVSKYEIGGLVAPNGKPSNLTPEQYKLVRTKEFKNWFGDWENDPENASKVVDENGEPLVVYHGTINKFYQFDKSFIASRNPTDIAKLGFWFTKDLWEARGFAFGFDDSYQDANGRIVESFLNIRNPLNVENKNIIQKLNDNYPNRLLTDGMFIEKHQVKIKTLLTSQNDGIVLNQIYIALNPNQIKLADGSNTTFDVNNPDIRFANGGNTDKSETFYTRTWNDGRVEKFSVDEYEKNIYPKLETGGLTQYAKMDRIKSLLYRAFPEIISLDLLGKGLTGYAFLGTIGNDVLVVKYFQSVTEYWLTQMAMVSNPPNVVKFKDVKQLSENFEYALIHEYVDTDALPNKYVWNYTLGFFPKENFPYLKDIPEKEKIYVSNIAKTKARAVEDYFGVTIDTNHSNWGYNEDRELVLFDLDGNIKKQQFLDWMDSHKQKLETGGEIYDYHSDEYAEGGTTESKEIIFDNGRLQIRNVGGSNVYYKKVNNQWDFLNETELKKLKEGAKHELEHSKTIKSAIQPEYNVNDIASAIAWDHLTEDMEYYDKLSKIEAPTKYATGGNIELKNEKMKIVTKWNEVPSNWRNVKGIKPLNFSFSPYDTKLQSIVKDFVSKDNLRPSLSGMFFDESGLTVTDAHKVLHLHFDNKEYSGIYPTVFTQKQIGYKGMNQEELAKQIALEKFPAYKNVIPKTFAFVNEFNVLKLRQYASSATNYANPTTHACIFKVKEESFAVNIDFLESTLEAFLKIKQVDKLYFHYNSPNNGFVISDIKNFDIDKDTYCLVMPVMIERMDISYGTFNDITDISYNVYFDFTDGEIHNADGSVAKIEITYEDNSMLPLPIITLLDKFIKNSKSKDRVNVLYNFYVDENFIMVSDLESSIRIKNDFNMQSGLYEIKNNAVQFNLSESADDFPSQNTFEKSEEDAMMSSRSFIFYIEKAKECIGSDELRPIMSGLLLDFQASGTYLVSTDAHVLCKLNISDSIKIYNKDLIGKQFVLGSIKQLDNFLSFIDCDSIQLSFEKNVDKNYSDNNEYRLTCGNKVFTAKLVDGKYPNYSAVIPFTTDKMISLNVKDIYECVNTQTAKSFIKNNEIKPNEVYFYNVNNELYLSSASGNKYENNESTKICDIPFDFKEASSTIDEKSSLILIMPIESNATHIAFKTYQFNKIMAMISKDNTTILYKNLTSPYVVTSKNLYYNEETFNTVIPKNKKESKPKSKPSVEKPKDEKTLDMYVELKSVKNLDHSGSEERYKNIPLKKVPVSSIEEAQRIVGQFIEDNDLGAGNWVGGDVYSGGKKVGKISYNRRFNPVETPEIKSDKNLPKFGYLVTYDQGKQAIIPTIKEVKSFVATLKANNHKNIEIIDLALSNKAKGIKGKQPIFKVGDMVFVNYGEEAGKKGKITKVFSYEKYPESMKPDEVPYYEISNVGKEIPESNLIPFSENKNFPNAKVQSLFIDYVNSFYGKGDSIYGKNFPNKGFTRAEIKKAVNTYLMRKDLIWGNADSVDRENVRDILLATLPETKPKEKTKSVSKQDYQDAIDGVELLLSTGTLNKAKKQELEDYLEGLKVMLMSMK